MAQRTPYPISSLGQITSYSINDLMSMYFEVVVDDYGDESFANRKATFKSFGDFIVSSHAIFNKIDDVFNDKTVSIIDANTGLTTYPHHADVYFTGTTYFKNNPYSNSRTDSLTDLKLNQLVRKEQLEDAIHMNNMEVAAIGKNFVYKQYTGRGTYDEKLETPIYDELNFKPFSIPATKCKFKTFLYNDTLYATNAIRMPRGGHFVTIVGKVKVPGDYLDSTSPYYTSELKLWAGVFYIENLIAITELHNIDENGVAYFSFQIPTGKDEINRIQRIRIVLPFKPDTAESDLYTNKRDLFTKIPLNTVAVFYYAKS